MVGEGLSDHAAGTPLKLDILDKKIANFEKNADAELRYERAKRNEVELLVRHTRLREGAHKRDIEISQELRKLKEDWEREKELEEELLRPRGTNIQV